MYTKRDVLKPLCYPHYCAENLTSVPSTTEFSSSFEAESELFEIVEKAGRVEEGRRTCGRVQ